MCFSVVKYQF